MIGLFPDLLPPEYRKTLKYPDTLPDLHGLDLDKGIESLIEYLLQVSHCMKFKLFNKHFFLIN